VLVFSTFSTHLIDGSHLVLQEAAAVPSCGLSNAYPNSVSAPRHGLHYCLVSRRYVLSK